MKLRVLSSVAAFVRPDRIGGRPDRALSDSTRLARDVLRPLSALHPVITKLTSKLAFAAFGLLLAGPGIAAPLNGQVLSGGAPIANSTVTLWAASEGAPKQLGQARTGPDGRFAIDAAGAPGEHAMLYLVAKGGTTKAAENKGASDALAMMALLGISPPKSVSVNELTTVALGIYRRAFHQGRFDIRESARTADRRNERPESREPAKR
jgi:hypothetical protein